MIEPQLSTPSSVSLRITRIPQCPFLIECSPAALDQIRREMEQARSSSHHGREIGGVLFGIHEFDRVRIFACKALPCEHAIGPGFVLSERDERALAELIWAPTTSPELKGLEALGWYHSHIRTRVFLSERDLRVHNRHFAAPYQIALVVHPRSDGVARAGFFFREGSGEMRTESSYEEFTIETPPPVARAPKPAGGSQQAHSHRRTPSPSKPEPQREAICPRCGSTHLQRSRGTGLVERLRGTFGFRPYRCHECLSRSFLKTSPDFLELARSSRRGRPEERRRARLRTRREVLLWSGGIFSFLAILYYILRDTDPKSDAP